MTAPHADNPFLQAVIANPDDDLTRLLYADWLDENGQPERAEFIRVQVALATGEPDADRRRYMEVRQRELLIAHDHEWVRELAEVLECPPGKWGGWVFRRGFVDYFHLSSATVCRVLPDLAKLTPVRSLYLNPATTDDVIALCRRRRPWPAIVRDLYLMTEPTGLQAAGALVLIDCPILAELKTLTVRLDNSVTRDAELLARFQTRFRGIWTG